MRAGAHVERQADPAAGVVVVLVECGACHGVVRVPMDLETDTMVEGQYGRLLYVTTHGAPNLDGRRAIDQHRKRCDG